MRRFGNLARDICPPLVWRALSLLRGRTPRRSPGPYNQLDSLGPGSKFEGQIEKRAAESQIHIGAGSLVHAFIATNTPEARVRIGDNVFVGGQTILESACEILIGDDVLISYQCILQDSDNHSHSLSLRRNDLAAWRRGTREWANAPKAAIRVRKGAWLGARSIILKGVTVGEGAIVGAGSVVTRDVRPWTVVAGNPAREVRVLCEED